MSAREYGIGEAQANLSKPVDAAVAGEEIGLVRDGLPVAKLISYGEERETSRGRGF